MTLVSVVAPHSAAVQETLTERGVAAVHAEAAARGTRTLALVIDGVDADERQWLAREAGCRGLHCLTGDDWAFLSGGASALAGLARVGVSDVRRVAEGIGCVLSGVLEPPAAWELQRGRIPLNRPVVVGILNVTPDSFSDGGSFLDPSAALAHAAALVAGGADMLDVGAESTRPGRPVAVSVEEEWRRLEPVVVGLVERHPRVPFSVDTVKAATAKRALDAGAWAINDVSGLRLEPDVAGVCAEYGAGLILMHSRGTVADMASYDHATYARLVPEVQHELQAAARRALREGLAPDHIVLDPGLGFAKTPDQTLTVLRDLSAVTSLGFPVMVGPSRKRFLGVVTGQGVAERDQATAAACVSAYLGGASLFRVHAVAPTREALMVAHAVRGARCH